jgi:hypothetical protein
MVSAARIDLEFRDRLGGLDQCSCARHRELGRLVQSRSQGGRQARFTSRVKPIPGPTRCLAGGLKLVQAQVPPVSSGVPVVSKKVHR